MIKNQGEITIEGVVIEIRDGHKQIRRNYTYGYRSLRVQVGVDYYSVLINTNKINEYGFLPKVGQWIRVTGRLSQAEDDYYDPSISWISRLEHIKSPKKEPKITNQSILKVMTPHWKSFSQIASEMGIENVLNKKLLKKKIEDLLRNDKIAETSKRGKKYWRDPNK
ncbi:MAG: hypothetical protein EU542_08130 [Promethearchaeota archaeon]|nr:MAG: hypothetical protein EU542_08130 [Candidatus Lokiarchaeota archaeon]